METRKIIGWIVTIATISSCILAYWQFITGTSSFVESKNYVVPKKSLFENKSESSKLKLVRPEIEFSPKYEQKRNNTLTEKLWISQRIIVSAREYNGVEVRFDRYTVILFDTNEKIWVERTFFFKEPLIVPRKGSVEYSFFVDEIILNLFNNNANSPETHRVKLNKMDIVLRGEDENGIPFEKKI